MRRHVIMGGLLAATMTLVGCLATMPQLPSEKDLIPTATPEATGTTVPAKRIEMRAQPVTSTALEEANVRKSPSGSAPLLETLTAGKQLTVTGSEGNWYVVESSSGPAYVHYKSLGIDVMEGDTFEGTVMSAAPVLDLPSSKSKKLLTLKEKSAVTVTEHEDKYYKISTGEKTGYVEQSKLLVKIIPRQPVAVEVELPPKDSQQPIIAPTKDGTSLESMISSIVGAPASALSPGQSKQPTAAPPNAGTGFSAPSC